MIKVSNKKGTAGVQYLRLCPLLWGFFSLSAQMSEIRYFLTEQDLNGPLNVPTWAPFPPAGELRSRLETCQAFPWFLLADCFQTLMRSFTPAGSNYVFHESLGKAGVVAARVVLSPCRVQTCRSCLKWRMTFKKEHQFQPGGAVV